VSEDRFYGDIGLAEPDKGRLFHYAKIFECTKTSLCGEFWNRIIVKIANFSIFLRRITSAKSLLKR